MSHNFPFSRSRVVTQVFPSSTALAIEKRERTLVSNHAISPVDVCELSGLKLDFKSDLDTNIVKFQKAKSEAGTKGARPQWRSERIEGRLERSGNRYAHPSAGPTVRKPASTPWQPPRTRREPQCTRGPGRVDVIAARADAATNALGSPAAEGWHRHSKAPPAP